MEIDKLMSYTVYNPSGEDRYRGVTSYNIALGQEEMSSPELEFIRRVQCSIFFSDGRMKAGNLSHGGLIQGGGI